MPILSAPTCTISLVPLLIASIHKSKDLPTQRSGTQAGDPSRARQGPALRRAPRRLDSAEYSHQTHSELARP
jgi:hypothetical protein